MAGSDDPSREDESEQLEGEPGVPAHRLIPLAGPSNLQPRPSFADYKPDARTWITLVTGEYYPDVLTKACALYQPVLVRFGQLLHSSESSSRLLREIANESPQWMRIQLARVFKRYVSPATPVELLKKKGKAQEICDQFGQTFRPIHEVQAAFDSRPMPDEALCALLWEYRERGKSGYDLTARFFEIFRARFPNLRIVGPVRGGKDVLLGTVFEGFSQPKLPADFVVFDGDTVLAVGFAHYDSDRGGAQEDDRPGHNREVADTILRHCAAHGLEVKVLFLNDGPGLLLGSMWDDYAAIETSWPGKVRVFSLRMMEERITEEWLRS